MKKIAALLLAAAMIFTLAACGNDDNTGGGAANNSGGNSEKTYIMRIGWPSADNDYNQSTHFSRLVKAAIEEKSGGRIEVQLYPGAQIGSAVEMLNGMMDGSVDSALMPHLYITTVFPEAMCLDLTYEWGEGWERQDNLLDAINNHDTLLEESMLEKGVVFASYMRVLPGMILSNRQINTVEDLKGLVCWTSSSPLERWKYEEIFGMTVATMTLGDLAAGMQNNTLDSVISDYSIFEMQSLYEYAPYMLRAPLDNALYANMISKSFLDSLPEDLQQIVLECYQQCADETSAWVREVPMEYFETSLTEKGAIIYDPNDELKTDIYNAIDKEQGEYMLATYPEVEAFYNQLHEIIYGN